MNTIICWVGVIVITLLVIYAIVYVLYLILKLQADPALSTEDMPALKPVPIPTKNQKTPIHKLVVFIIEVRKWEVVENWHYKLNDDVELVIPKGFRFDGASIPRPFWAILSPTGLLLISGLLHDYGYMYDQIWQVGPRGEAIPYQKGAGKDFWDKLFKDVGKEVNGIFLINAIAWLAVAVAGSGTWNKHREAGLEPDKPDSNGLKKIKPS